MFGKLNPCFSIKTIIIIIMLLLDFPNKIHSQDNVWYQTNGPYEGNVGAIVNDSRGNFFAGTDLGLYRSTDSGKHWDIIACRDTPVFTLCFDNSRNILAAPGEGNLQTVGASPFRGIYKSNDLGINWSQILFNHYWQGSYCITCVAVNKGGDIYAGTYNNGIFRSTDDGNTWSHLGLKDTTGIVSSIIFDKSGAILAGTEYRGIFRSTDDGTSWNRVSWAYTYSLAEDSLGNMFSASYYGIYKSTDNGITWNLSGLDSNWIRSVFVSSSGKIFAGTNHLGLYCSTDNGVSWFSTGLHKIVISFSEDPTGNIFAGTVYDGIYKSADDGKSWVENGVGLINTIAYSMAVDLDNNIFVSTRSGISCSKDKGNSWQSIAFIDTNIFAGLYIDKTNRIFVASASYGLFCSTDSGSSWQQLFGDHLATCVAIDSSGTIFCGTSMAGINRSTDNGKSWKLVNTGLVGGIIFDMKVAKDNSIIAATQLSVCRSTNEGQSWTPVIENVNASCLAADSKGNLYAGLNWDGVFRSTDNGNSWTQTNGLGSVEVKSLAVNSKGDIFAGTWYGGVFKSSDMGNTWMPYNSGLTCDNISSLVIDNEGYLYAGTLGHGVFRTERVTSVQKEKYESPVSFRLFQNYPNPFNPSTVIHYEIPDNGHVMLKVYNELGQEIKTLVNQYQSKGRYDVSFNASDLSSGIYIYRLQAGSFIFSKKMILLK